MLYHSAMRAFLMLLALSLAGCSTFNIAGDDCSLSITNGTSATLWFLYIQDAGTDDWGLDVLDAERLEDGETYTTTVTVGDYDVRGEWPSPDSETFTRLEAASCVDGEELGVTLSLTDED